MSFIDVTVPYVSGQGAVSAQVGGAGAGYGGAPYGGAADTTSQPQAMGTPAGKHGLGGSGAVHHWVLAFYLIIGVVLLSAGVIFNGKGR
jgi:hypothetical protein